MGNYFKLFVFLLEGLPHPLFNCNSGAPNCLQEQIFFQRLWILWKYIDGFMVCSAFNVRLVCLFRAEITVRKLCSFWLYRVFICFMDTQVRHSICRVQMYILVVKLS